MLKKIFGYGNGNQEFLVSWRFMIIRLLVAIVSGVLLGIVFPPFELTGLVWVAMIPLLLLPIPRRRCWILVIGYVWGFSCNVIGFWWLNRVGFGVGLLVAGYCALYFMVWYFLLARFLDYLLVRGEEDGGVGHLCWLLGVKNGINQVVLVLVMSSAWVVLEWIRGWIFTGFLWNMLAISQWRNPLLLHLSSVTGVYGISFLLVAVNISVGLYIGKRILLFREKKGYGVSYGLAVPVVMFLWVFALYFNRFYVGKCNEIVRVLGVQGNVVQCRKYTPEQLSDALGVYSDFTLKMAGKGAGIDLVVWPETAIPAPLNYDDGFYTVLQNIFKGSDSELLLGAVYLDVAKSDIKDGRIIDYRMTNSAFHFSATGVVLGRYDKIKRVPFGEFVPFARYCPWLVGMIGMGRELTAGRDYTLFALPHGAKGGVNICYEDVFPNVSRRFTNNGANILFTLTNDAWYKNSAGARQHLLHAVFRAVENRRPLFHSGNNSETCLIMPNGKIVEPIIDKKTGNRFVRAAKVYDVPIWYDAGITFYTRYGDWFVYLCLLVVMVAAGFVVKKYFSGKAALLNKIYEVKR